MQRWKELPYLYKVQIISYLTSGICGAICYPLTTKVIYSNVDTDALASRLVLSSSIGIALSLLWLNIQEKLYRWFVHFTLLEFIAYSLLIIYTIIYKDFNQYIIFNALIGGTIGHIVSGANSKLHQQITDNEQYRTDYGFFIEIVASIGILIGSAIAVSFNITFNLAFVLLLFELMLFQMVDIYVYIKVKRKNNG